MRSIREYIKASLSDSSHILYTNTHSVPRGVVDFTFIRAPVKRIANVLSKGFPSGEHVYDLTPRWRVADCSRGVPFAHINGARREFPPAVEAHAPHALHAPHAPHALHAPRLLGYIIGGLHVFIG